MLIKLSNIQPKWDSNIDLILQNEIQIKSTLSHIQPKWDSNIDLILQNQIQIESTLSHIQPKWDSNIEIVHRDHMFDVTKYNMLVIKITLSLESFMTILQWFSEGAPRLRIQTIAPYPRPQDNIICARMAWAKTSVFKFSRMVSITWESKGIPKTYVACSRAGPRITCFWLSKVGSPGSGARYERRDNASTFTCAS